MTRAATSFILMFLLSACEHTGLETTMSSPPPKSIRADAADPAYRLTPQVRASLAPGIDPDALERLLAMIQPDARAHVLASFQPGRKEGPGWSLLLGFDDPQLDAVLEEVWQPTWDEVPTGALEDPAVHPYLPGRELAKKRRDARTRPTQQLPESRTD